MNIDDRLPDEIADHRAVHAATQRLIARLHTDPDARAVWDDANALINAVLNHLGADMYPIENDIESDVWRDFKHNAYALLDTLMHANDALARQDRPGVIDAFERFALLWSGHCVDRQHLATAHPAIAHPA